jgi:hypothetical protein
VSHSHGTPNEGTVPASDDSWVEETSGILIAQKKTSPKTTMSTIDPETETSN